MVTSNHNCMDNLFVGTLIESDLTRLIQKLNPNKIAILTDENTYEHCLSLLMNSVAGLESAEILQVEAGESSKDLEIVTHLYGALTEYGFGRYDLLINLGGGVITDLGGFLGSTYKRGIRFINVPTSLLGMVDAAIGGKNGVNLGVYKNQVGTINFPVQTFIDPAFLQTLPETERLSGYAEAIKHGIIHGRSLFEKIINSDPGHIDAALLEAVCSVKADIVKADPFEKGDRKLLNFGHTYGHALEGVMMEGKGITHGCAIAIGMLVESRISLDRGLLNNQDWELIKQNLMLNYPIPHLSQKEIDRLLDLLQNDKKNHSGTIRTCLIEGIGRCIIDQEVSAEEFRNAFNSITNDL